MLFVLVNTPLGYTESELFVVADGSGLQAFVQVEARE